MYAFPSQGLFINYVECFSGEVILLPYVKWVCGKSVVKGKGVTQTTKMLRYYVRNL